MLTLSLELSIRTILVLALRKNENELLSFYKEGIQFVRIVIGNRHFFMYKLPRSIRFEFEYVCRLR